MAFPARLALGLALLLVLWALGQETFRPEVELTRKEKRVVAWVSGEEESLFYADYGDLWVGVLEDLAQDRVRVGGVPFSGTRGAPWRRG